MLACSSAYVCECVDQKCVDCLKKDENFNDNKRIPVLNQYLSSINNLYVVSFSYYIFPLDVGNLKFKDEKRGLDEAEVSIEQGPVNKSLIVTGISDNTTQTAIELCFESRRNNGGPVERVHFVEKSGQAVVVFQDSRGV